MALDSGAMRFARTRGRATGSLGNGTVHYPTPFFDIGHTYLPTSVKELFHWCRYYFYVHPLINTTVTKLSQYPITDIFFQSENKELSSQWRGFLEDDLRYRSFMLDGGLDYWAYGNMLSSIFFPFKKMLTCQNCGFSHPVKQAKYQFRTYKFFMDCPKCSHTGEAKATDHYIKNRKGIRLLRWNPEDIDIRYNDLNGEYTYYYEIPGNIKNDIMMGRRDTVENIPQLFIEALRRRKAIVFSKDNIFHMRRPTLAGKDRGWGTPLILPVLKDAYYLQLLKKSQESIMLEHIVPLRIMFPQAGSGSSDPYCVSLDTLIETSEGLKPAGEVTSGDYVKSHNGLWRKVQCAVDREVDTKKENVFEIKVSGLTAFPFKITDEHPIYGAKRDKAARGYSRIPSPDWVLPKDLDVGDFVCYPIHREVQEHVTIDMADFCPERGLTDRYIYRRLDKECAAIYENLETEGLPEFGHGEKVKFLDKKGWSEKSFNNARTAFVQQDRIDRMPRYLQVTKELAYVCGLYAAQGSSSNGLAHLAFNSEFTGLIDELDRCIKALGFRNSTYSTNGGTTVYCIQDIFLSAILEVGCGRGAQNKRLPHFVMDSANPIAMEAVYGVFDGDGCDFRTATKRVGLKTTSPQLAMDAREILLSEGFIPTVQKAIPREDEIAKLPYYQVNLNVIQADAYSDGKTPSDFDVSPGKISRCGFIRGDYVYLRIAEKTVVDVDTVRGFQISGDKSFCVAGVATHNSMINLSEWQGQVREEIQRWRIDANYIPVLPLPIGNQSIGGDGRALMLGQEIRVWSEQLVIGMGVPVELIFGGVSWSGTNVSLRMLENLYLGYMQDHYRLLQWVIKNTASYLNWETVETKFKPFKMADDLQRKAYNFQLNQAGKISDEALLRDADFDPKTERESIIKETNESSEAMKKTRMAQAEIEGQAQMIMSKYQMKAQMESQQMMQQAPAPGEPGAEAEGVQQDSAADPMMQMQSQMPQGQAPQGQANVDIRSLAMQIAQHAMSMDPQNKQALLANVGQQNPELLQLVQQLMNSMWNAAPQGGGQSAAGQPLPEQKPPRRDVASAAI